MQLPTTLHKAFKHLPQESISQHLHSRIMICATLLKYRLHIGMLLGLIVFHFIYFSWGIIQLMRAKNKNLVNPSKLLDTMSGDIQDVITSLLTAITSIPTGVLLRYVISFAIVLLSVSFVLRMRRDWKIFSPGFETLSSKEPGTPRPSS